MKFIRAGLFIAGILLGVCGIIGMSTLPHAPCCHTNYLVIELKPVTIIVSASNADDAVALPNIDTNSEIPWSGFTNLYRVVPAPFLIDSNSEDSFMELLLGEIRNPYDVELGITSTSRLTNDLIFGKYHFTPSIRKD